MITIAQAKLKPDALAGLERWKGRPPEVAKLLAPEDILEYPELLATAGPAEPIKALSNY